MGAATGAGGARCGPAIGGRNELAAAAESGDGASSGGGAVGSNSHCVMQSRRWFMR